MTEVALILAAGALAFALFRWSGIPVIPLLILSGLLLSAAIPRLDREVLQEILLLGLTFLLFSAGTELNPQRVGKHLTAAATVGLLQFFLHGGAAVGAAMLLKFSWLTSFYLGLGVAASSTLVVLRLLQQREQFFEPFGRLVVGVLLVQDILVIFFISILSHSDRGVAGMALAAFKTLVLTGVAIAFLRWAAPRLLVTFVLDEETLLLLLLAILFLFVGLAQLLGLPLMLGAFWGGVSVSGFPIRGFIRGTLHSLSNFFVVAFFTTLGAILGWPDLSELLLTALLVCLVYLITPPLVTFLAERAGMSGRAALESGLLLSQTSEFSIILAVVGLQQGHISGSILEVMTLVTVITMVLTPMVATDKMAWRLLRLHPSRWQRKPVAAPSGHILLLGCGESGRLIADSLLQAGKPVVVIDDDPAVVQQLRSAGMNAIRGDGADYRVLDAAGARQARVIVSTMRRFRDHTAVLKYAKGAKVICRVFEERDANRLRHRGAIVVLYSIPAAEDFLRWFDRQYHCEPPA